MASKTAYKKAETKKKSVAEIICERLIARTHYFGKAMILSNKRKEAPAQAQERSVEQDKSKKADVAIQ